MEKERKRYIMTIQEKKQVLAQYQTTKREIIRLTKERDDWNDLAYRNPIGAFFLASVGRKQKGCGDKAQYFT